MKERKRYTISYDVWNKLVDSLGKDAIRIVAKVDRMRGILTNIVSNKAEVLLGLGTSIPEYSLRNDAHKGIIKRTQGIARRPTAGVDSSNTPPIRVVNYFYSAVSSASVIYPEGIGNEPEFIVHASGVMAPDRAEPSYAKTELYLGMFDEELKALRSAIAALLRYSEEKGEAPVLFLDGPIVDPPSFASTAKRAGKEFEGKYMAYVRDRAEEILRLVSAGGLAIGYVKRVYGTMFTNMLADTDEEIREFVKEFSVSDFALTSLIRDILAEKLCTNGGDYTLVFKGFLLPDDVADANLYRQHGLEVLTFYIVPRLCGNIADARPARVEVALPKTEISKEDLLEQMRNAAGGVLQWLVPGVGLPEPVLLAHRRCTIRRSEARKILKEIASRSVEREAARENPAMAARIAKTLIV